MAKKTTAKKNKENVKILENGLVLSEEDMTILGLSEEKRRKNQSILKFQKEF